MASNYQITVTIDGRDNLSDELRQMNTQLTQIQQNTTNTNTNLSRMESQISGLRTGLTNANGLLQQFGLGISAMGIASAVQELGDLGREVNAVETTFTQLAGGPDAARRSLENLREITGGVVDDMTLMRGANSLLLTGLASTNDQAAELVNLGYRLSAAMGVDAKDGIENLNAALLNNSFARLDTLGISAAAVRQRVAELKEEGYDMSEAFSQAVLEQGREKLELLGEAANTGETAFNRMSTSFANAKGRLAEFTAEGFEAGAQLLEMIGLMGEVGIGNVITAAGGGEVDLEAQQRNQVIQTRTQEIVTEQLGGGTATEALGMTAGFTPAERMQTEQIAMQTITMNALAQATRELAAEEQRLNINRDMLTATTSIYEAATSRAAAAQNRLARENSVEQSILEGLGIAFDTLTQRAEEFQSIGGIEILSAEDADAMTSNAEMMEDWYAELAQMAEDTEFEYISEEELARAEAMVDEAGALADEAQRAADNFEKMKLAQMLGESGGGRLGELGDMVLSNIEDPAQREAMERQYNLASGRETDVSVAFEEQIAPLLAQITEQMGSEAGIGATERALSALEEGRLMGMTSDELVNAVVAAIGITTSGSAIAGQMQSDLAMQAGMSSPDLLGPLPISVSAASGEMGGTSFSDPMMAAWAGGMETPGTPGTGEGGSPQLEGLQEQFDVLEDDMLMLTDGFTNLSGMDLTGVLNPMEHSLDTVNEAANVLIAKLDTVAGKTYTATLQLDLKINDQTGFNLANDPAFAAAVGNVNRNNGGASPGTTGPE